jgi:hypothetical protein
MRFADEPAECPFTRQVTRGVESEFRPINAAIYHFDRTDRLDRLVGDDEN